MKGERILYASDSDLAREGMTAVIEKYASKDGHKLIGQASSCKEVKELLEGGLKPTVFILDPQFPYLSDGQEAVTLVRRRSPETTIITIARFEGLKMGDYNLVADVDVEKLINLLTDLQHKHLS